MTFILMAIGFAFVGCAVAIFLVVLKGTIAYRAQHPKDDDDDDVPNTAGGQPEGGSAENHMDDRWHRMGSSKGCSPKQFKK